MTGKKLTRNLKYYIEDHFIIPTVTFDRNATKVLPCIVIGYSEEQLSFPGNHGHYTVSGYVSVQYNGYEDEDNDLADADAQTVVDLLLCNAALLSTVNSPISGIDPRPLSGFHLNGLIVRNVEREIDEKSMVINVKFDAFCVPIDR